MIIDVAIKPMELKLIPEHEVTALFSELGRASVLGYHRVFMDEDLAEWVLDEKNVSLSSRHRERFGDIMDTISERGNQVKRAKCKMIIKIGVDKNIELVEFRKSNKVEKCHWIVNYKNFVNGMTLDPTILLTENSLNDGQLFNMIFDLEAERCGLSPLSSFRFNGGGSSTEPIFADLVKYGKICLAIADQDFYDSRSKGGKKLIKRYTKIKDDDIIGLVDLTPGDKIENFLSFKTIKTVYENLVKRDENFRLYKDCVENLEKIEKIIENTPDIDESIWLKLDIKKEFIRENFTDVNSDIASKKLNENYKMQKVNIANNKHDGFKNFKLVEKFLDCREAVLEFEDFVKSDLWKQHYKSWLETKIWFLCGDDIYSG